MKKSFILILTLFVFFQKNNAQISLNMNKLDQWDESGLEYNDVWGYVDDNDQEYAIVGSYGGIHFFHINNNNALTLVDEFSPGATSVWRDFKTYGNYAYAVADEGSEGLLVYDLSNLPNSVSLSHQITTQFTRAHNIYIDEPNGKLYVAGSNGQNDGLIIYDVTTNPPTYLASVSLPNGGYVHDLYVRGDTAYCSHGWNGLFIWDMESANNPNLLGAFSNESGYNHSSWVSSDASTLYYAREVGVGLPMTVLDISNMNDIGVTSNFKFPLLGGNQTDNVPHNPYLLGNYLYTSYYEDGVQVFDVSDPANVTVAAYYDTYPSNTQYNGYAGCWGTYPYLPSGKILASDGTNGLFLLELDFPTSASLTINIVNQTEVVCEGESNGTIEIAANNGTSPYSFSINGGTAQSNGLFQNLGAGVYNIIVTDGTGATESIELTITEAIPLTMTTSVAAEINCYEAATGSISVNVLNGNSSVIISINGNSQIGNSAIFENLSAGTYTVIASDENHCETSETVVLTQPNAIILTLENVQHIDCGSNTEGSFQVSASGGIGNYSYSVGSETNTTGLFENLLAGIHDCIVTDENDCTQLLKVTIDGGADFILNTLEVSNVSCFGENNGSAFIKVNGGTGDLVYSIGNISNASGSFNNLETGAHDIVATDANNCTSTYSIQISEPSELEFNIENIFQIKCFGEMNGAVQLASSGGTPPFNFTIDGNSNTNGLFENLPKGNYETQVTDSKNCTKILHIEITEPLELKALITQTVADSGSGDGSITFELNGGTPPYSLSIDGQDYQSGVLFVELIAGNYIGYFNDANGCEIEFPFEIGVQTSISNIDLGIQEIKVYPNPFSETINLELDILETQNITVELINITGQQVFQKNIKVELGKNNIKINLPLNLTSGSYFLKVLGKEKQVGYFKLIKL